MAAVQAEVFEAFRAIDIPQAKAMTAAKAPSHRDDDVTSIRDDLSIVTWMVGTLYPLIFAIMLKLYMH